MLKVPFTKEMIDMQYMLPRLTNRKRSLCGTDIQSLENIRDAAAQTRAELSIFFLLTESLSCEYHNSILVSIQEL